VLGLRDWLSGKRRKEARARKKELSGRLDDAVELYLDAEVPDEAARVLVLKAESEPEPQRRMVILAQAVRIGGGGEHARDAERRRALLSFDQIREAPGGSMRSELERAAMELERLEQWDAAVEAFVLLGDTEAELRVLRESGNIEQLERRLRETSGEARRARDRKALLNRVADLDRLAERRAAIASCRQWLEREADEQVELQIQRIRNRLLAGPCITLELDGEPLRYALGSEITIGRAAAVIQVAASAISRQHLRLFRDADGRAMVEDLDTRNGTQLAGARISAPLPIGDGLALQLGGQVSCVLGVDEHGSVLVDVAGARHVAPLGSLRLLDWLLVDAHDGGDRFVVLRTPDGKRPPFMGSYQLAAQIELCVGDRLSLARDARERLVVPDQSSSGAAA
jgi:hypothetical protein